MNKIKLVLETTDEGFKHIESGISLFKHYDAGDYFGCGSEEDRIFGYLKHDLFTVLDSKGFDIVGEYVDKNDAIIVIQDFIIENTEK